MQLSNQQLLNQIEELAMILKPWRDHLVVGGGVALVLYDIVLSNANAGAIGTTDIDYLIPRKPIMLTGNQKISELLTRNGFQFRSKSLLYSPAVESYFKQIDEIEIEVEFLTDNKSRNKNDVVVIQSAGVHAQALSYIEMSLKEAMPLILPNCLKIMVVKPEAWIFHKGLTFVRRSVRLKQYKDIYGIWFVLTQLNEVSLAVPILLKHLMSRSPLSWSKTLKKNIKSWIDGATPEDWHILENQDISGRLTKNNFIQATKFIVQD